MPPWTYVPETASYTRQTENGVYLVVQTVDGTWRAIFLPTGLGRYQTDDEAMRAVDDYLARRL